MLGGGAKFHQRVYSLVEEVYESQHRAEQIEGGGVTKLFRCGDSERNDSLTLTGLNKLETQEIAWDCEGCTSKKQK